MLRRVLGAGFRVLRRVWGIGFQVRAPAAMPSEGNVLQPEQSMSGFEAMGAECGVLRKVLRCWVPDARACGHAERR